MKYLINAFFLLISCLSFDNTVGNQEETQLRNTLFSNYNPKVRPVRDISSELTVEMGLALQNIEKFDQMQESITLNAWIRFSICG